MEITNTLLQNSDVNSLYNYFYKNNIKSKCLLAQPDDLCLLNYFKNENYEFNLSNMARECRGLIISKKLKKVIAYNYPKNIKNNLNNNIEDFVNSLYKGNEKLELDECIEGSQIMVYYYDGRWNVSTRNKLDAKKSIWKSSMNFYDLYYYCISQLYDINHYEENILNKDYCYTFIIQTKEAEKILNVEKDKIYHLLTRDMTKADYGIVEHDIGIEKVNKVEIDKDELIADLTYNTNIKHQGYYDSKRNIKLYYDKYLFLNKLYGNMYNMIYRFIELFKNDQLELFILHFPKYNETFTEYEVLLKKFIKSIHKTYFRKFVSKEHYDKE